MKLKLILSNEKGNEIERDVQSSEDGYFIGIGEIIDDMVHTMSDDKPL